MRLLLFFYIFFFSLIGINSKEKTLSCDDVIKKNGFFLLKYTFVKFSGTCYTFDDNKQLTNIKTYVDGEEDGVFKNFNNILFSFSKTSICKPIKFTLQILSFNSETSFIFFPNLKCSV